MGILHGENTRSRNLESGNVGRSGVTGSETDTRLEVGLKPEKLTTNRESRGNRLKVVETIESGVTDLQLSVPVAALEVCIGHKLRLTGFTRNLGLNLKGKPISNVILNTTREPTISGNAAKKHILLIDNISSKLVISNRSLNNLLSTSRHLNIAHKHAVGKEKVRIQRLVELEAHALEEFRLQSHGGFPLNILITNRLRQFKIINLLLFAVCQSASREAKAR
mmetsp:Transcript_28902/g.53103  ORF Transcript_28902/g.53103 Transcript_28902/m.53103 type:complete len:222 (+) Transcript_28902:696-1361(+)